MIDPDKYYSNREVQALENFSKSTHYDWVNRGLFPKPTKLGPRKVGTLGRVLIEHREKLTRAGKAARPA